MHNVVASIICTEYDKQFRNDRFPKADEAMVLRFSLSPDYSKEEGYRHLNIMILGGGGNYIGVYARIDWNVISLEALEGDEGLKPGYEYTEGKTPWVVCSYHDSCWREDGVRSLMFKFRDRIQMLDTAFGRDWYEVVKLTPEQIKEFAKLREYNSREKWVSVEEQEFKF